MIIKITAAAMLTVAIWSGVTHASAVTDTFLNTKDFRVTDDYTSLTYGALVSDIMIYRGADEGIAMSGGQLDIDTDNEFEISTRADITDIIAEESSENGIYSFSFRIDAERMEKFSLATKDQDGVERIICSGIDTTVNQITVLLDGKYASVLIDNSNAGISLCNGLPVFELRGSGVTAVITEVSYGVAGPEENFTIIDSINFVSDADFPTTLEAGITKLSLGAELFSNLPECDRNSIIQRVKNAVPFEDEAEFSNTYKKSLECVTAVDTSQYAKYFTDGFGGGIDEFTWEKSGNPLVRKGGSDVFGGSSYCYDLNTQGTENNTLVTAGASLSGSGGIERDIKLDKSIVKLYFYDNMKNNPASYSVMVNDSLKVGVYDRYGSYVCRENGSVLKSSVVRSIGWHKMVFDTISQGGLAVYIDDIKIYENADMNIEKLFIGNADTFASYSWFSTDNISIAAEDGAVAAEFTNRIMLVGESGGLTVKKYTKNGIIDISDQYEFKYTSGSENVIKAGENNITALSFGKAYVSAEAIEKSSGTAFSEECEIYAANKERMVVSEYSENGAKVSVKLTADNDITEAVLVIAVYNKDGTLSGLQMKELKDIKDGTAVYSIDTGSYNEEQSKKIFLFSRLDNMMPIWKAEEVN